MQSDFDLDPDLIYVNHAAVAPWPVNTVKAVRQFAEENGRLGSRHYDHWLKTEQSLKQSLASLINAPSADDIALLKNTSEGLSIIAQGLAQGLQWQAGDNIVISDQEFPSNFIVWDALRARGVELRIANITHSEQPEQAVINQIDQNTRLLSISSVQYASGLRLDLSLLSAACRAHNALFCVDAIQQIGALEFDVQSIDADFVVADGHKWMLGPEGLALFYCRAEVRELLALQQFGWHMVEDLSDFSNMKNWQPASTARRFECGSPNMLAAHALHASVQLLLQHGMATIETRVLDHVQSLIQRFSQIPGVDILSPTLRERHGGIMTFSLAGADHAKLYDWLVEKGTVCALRGGGIRFSPHYYNDTAQFDTLANWIEDYRQG